MEIDFKKPFQNQLQNVLQNYLQNKRLTIFISKSSVSGKYLHIFQTQDIVFGFFRAASFYVHEKLKEFSK